MSAAAEEDTPEFVSYSTLTDEELEAVDAAYGVKHTCPLAELSGGYANSNFKYTTDKGVYCLKVCDEKTVDELKVQLAVLEVMRAAGYRTCYPVPLADSTDCLFLLNDKRIVLYDFLNGSCPTETNAAIASALGGAIGDLHLITDSVTDTLPTFPMSPEVTDDIRASPLGSHEFLSYLDKLLGEYAASLSADLPKAIIHGDVFLDNTMFEGDSLVGIIDFEEVAYDVRILDVAMAIVGCCFTPENTIDVGLASSLLKSYREKVELTEAEIACFGDFIRYAALSIAFWRWRQFNYRAPNERNKDTYKQMVARVESVTDEAVAQLLSA